jgi:squalene cyclase
LIYAYVQADRKNLILPLCHECHVSEGSWKEELDWIMISRMTEDDFAEYPKINWHQKIEYLSKKFSK